jgi:hypothetical protein
MLSFRNSKRHAVRGRAAKDWVWPHYITVHDLENPGPGLSFPAQAGRGAGWQRWRGTPNSQRLKELLKQAKHGSKRAVKVLAQKFGIKYTVSG